MTKCTWKECEKESVTERKRDNGQVWANLCYEHDKQLNDALINIGKEGGTKNLLRCWVLSRGGTEKMAEDMFK